MSCKTIIKYKTLQRPGSVSLRLYLLLCVYDGAGVAFTRQDRVEGKDHFWGSWFSPSVMVLGADLGGPRLCMKLPCQPREHSIVVSFH